MRNLIASQQVSRSRRSTLAVRLRIIAIAATVIGGATVAAGVAMRRVLG
jgi:hypothetical protein